MADPTCTALSQDAKYIYFPFAIDSSKVVIWDSMQGEFNRPQERRQYRRQIMHENPAEKNVIGNLSLGQLSATNIRFLKRGSLLAFIVEYGVRCELVNLC